MGNSGTTKVYHIIRLMLAIARLHNFSINKRLLMLADNNTDIVFTPTDVSFNVQHNQLRHLAANFEYDEALLNTSIPIPWSQNQIA
jgi:hypothetical protein